MAQEVHVTQLPVLAELEPIGQIDLTQFLVLGEIASDSIAVTQFLTLAEIANDGVSVTQFMVLLEVEEVEVTTHFEDAFHAGPKPHVLLPDDAVGYQLDEGNSFWSVIVPEATINLIANPSFEKNDTGYTVTNFAANLRVTNKATSGCYAYKMVPAPPLQGSISYQYNVRVAGWHTFSLDIYHTIGQHFQIKALAHSGSTLGLVNITARKTGWARYSLTYFDPTASAPYDRTVEILSLTTNSGEYPIYTDRWQVEQKTYATTYCDGELQEDIFDPDPYAYGWEGLPHESCSVRSATTFGGGRIVSLYDTIKFKTTGIVGLGLGDPTLDLANFADGSEIMRGYQQPAHDFSVIGKIFGKGSKDLQGKRLELLSLLNQAKRRGGQMVLRYQPIDYAGRFYGLPLDIKCSYAGGLSGNYISHYQETIELKFHSFDGRINEDFGNVTTLATIQSFENANPGFESGAIERDPLTGAWSFLASTANVVGGDILCACYLADGRLAVGGSFSSINGVSAHKVAIYDPRTGVWDKLGSATPGADGFNNDVLTLALGRGIWAGYLLAGGKFTGNASSTSVFQHVAYWDFIHTTHWNSMVGLNDYVYTLAVDSYGNIHAGGDFTQDGAGTTVVKYGILIPGGTVWRNVFTYLNAAIRKILIDPRDVAYLAGDFQRVNTETLGSHIISYDDYNQPIGAPDPVIGLMFAPDQPVTDMAFDNNGVLNICGTFTKQGWYTTSGPDVTQGDCFYVARWNGSRWEDYGSHLVNAYRMAIDKRGIVYVSCNTVTDGEYTDGTSLTILQAYNGSSWFPFGPRAQSSTSPTTGQIVVSARGKLLICYGTASEVVTPGHTLVNYPGSLPGKIRLRIETDGYARLHVLSNWTTGQHVYFKDIQVYKDNFYFDTTGVHVRVYSDEHGDLTNSVLLGISDLDNFTLAPGDNHITLMVNYDAGVTVNAYLTWKNQHATIDVASQSA